MAIEKSTEFKEDPAGWQLRWTQEMEAAEKWLKKWKKQAREVNDRFLDNKGNDIGDFSTRLNLFHSNIVTVQSMLYGRLPKVDVDRRFADQNDDVARIAGQILQRILNTDIESAGEDYSCVLRAALGDRLIVGLGTARLKYDFDLETTTVEPIVDTDGNVQAEGYTDEHIATEWTDTVYVHWNDLLWSPCRTYAEMRWRAYRVYMTREELIARFGAELGGAIPLNSKGPTFDKGRDGAKEKDVWDQAEIWEIWDKQNRKVFWYVKGFDKILDMKDDPLRLEGFYPEPPAMLANVTTSKYVPKPDFCMAQDLYNQIDVIESRITLLTDACRAVGVYDKGNDGVQRVFQEGIENQLIPVDNWAAFAEKGGLKGAVDWIPIEQIATVIELLTKKQADLINQLYQVTGMADILRGASTMQASATEQAIKAKFASIRVQALQDEFARFASDLQRIKAEIIAKHYQPYCIVQQSNIMTSPDAQIDGGVMVQQAIELIKKPETSRWKIQVKPETLAMVDYAQLRMERTEYINALAIFLQSAAPLVEMDASAVPFLMQLMKWGLAGFKGAQEIEGVVDQAISAFEKKLQQGGDKKPDPAAMKAQAEVQKIQMQMQMMQQKHQLEMQQSQAEFQLEMRKAQMEFQLEMKKLLTEVWAERQKQEAQLQANTTESIINASAKKVEMESRPKGTGGSSS